MPFLAPVVAGIAAAGGAAVGGTAAAVGTAIGLAGTAAVVAGAVIIGVATAALSALQIVLTSSGSGRPARSSEVILRSVSSPVQPRQLVYGRIRKGGARVFVHTSSNKKTLNSVYVWAAHTCEEIEQIQFNERLVWDQGVYQRRNSKFDYDEFMEHDEFRLGANPSPVYSTLVSRAPQWTDDHKLDGLTTSYIRLFFNRLVYARGIPNITATIRGKNDIFDPRTSTTGYTANTALVIRDILTDTELGLSVHPSRIDDASFIAAANLCDEDVSLAGGGTEKRYETHGVIDVRDLAENPLEVLRRLLAPGKFNLTWAGGKVRITGGAFTPSVMDFDDKDYVAPISVQTRRSTRESYNAVRGIFRSIELDYIDDDYPEITSATFEAEDGGERRYTDLALEYVTSVTQAQRIAKIHLLQSRQQLAVQVTVTLKGLKVHAGETVRLTSERMGWNLKEFEVVGYLLTIDQNNELAVNLSLKDTSAAVWDFLTSEESPYVTGDPTDLPLLGDVDPPSNLVVTPITSTQADGAVVPALQVTWDASPDETLRHYELQWTTDAFVTIDSHFTSGLQHTILGVSTLDNYTVRVRAVDTNGSESDFVTATSVQPISDSTPPSPPGNLTVVPGFEGVTVFWQNPTDADFDRVRVYESSDNIEANAVVVVETRGTSIPRAGLPTAPEEFFYWVSAVDRTGNESALTGPVSVTTTQVGTAQLADDLITSSKLATGDFSNLVPDFHIDDEDVWTVSGTGFSFSPGVVTGFQSKNTWSIDSSALTSTGAVDTRTFSVEAGSKYYISAQVEALATPSSPDLRGALQVRWLDENGNTASVATVQAFTLTAIGVVQLEDILEAPADAKFARVRIAVFTSSTSDGRFGSYIARRAGEGNLIAQDTIAARNLVVGDFSNLAPDFHIEDESIWTILGSSISRVAVVVSGMQSKYHWAYDVSLKGSNDYVGSKQFIVEEGAVYYCRAEVQGVANPGVVDFRGVIGFIWYDEDGAILSAQTVTSFAVTDEIVSRVDGQIAPPVGAKFGLLRVFVQNTSTSDGRFGSYVVRRAGEGELIVDGAIIADKLSVNSIEADKIVAGAVLTPKLADNAVSDFVFSSPSGSVSVTAVNTFTDVHSASYVVDDVDTEDFIVVQNGASASFTSFSVVNGQASFMEFRLTISNDTQGTSIVIENSLFRYEGTSSGFNTIGGFGEIPVMRALDSSFYAPGDTITATLAINRGRTGTTGVISGITIDSRFIGFTGYKK